MLPKELNIALQVYKKKVFVYIWEYFKKRIHDEQARSVLEKSPFFYIEIKFNVVEKELPQAVERYKFWMAFFEVLATQKRFNDLCGFLNNNEGIAILFTDNVLNTKETNSAWNRFCSEIKNSSSFDLQNWSEIVYAEYPPKEFLKF